MKDRVDERLRLDEHLLLALELGERAAFGGGADADGHVERIVRVAPVSSSSPSSAGRAVLEACALDVGAAVGAARPRFAPRACAGYAERERRDAREDDNARNGSDVHGPTSACGLR